MKAPATVLHVIDSLDIGGTEKQLYLLLKHLDRRRFTPVVAALSEGGFWVEPVRKLGVELIELRRRRSYDIRRLTSLVKLSVRRQPAILHAWLPQGNVYGGIAGMLARAPKTILSRRSLDDYQGIKGILDGIVHRHASVVICNSQFLADDLAERFGAALNSLVIYNGIEAAWASRVTPPGAMKEKLDLPEACTIVGTVGRLVPFKNQRFIIEVARELRERRSDCYFLLAGDGPLRGELEDYARRLEVTDRVIFLGYRTDVAELLTAFDVFLFPSVHGLRDRGMVLGEGLPNAVMEAMLAGVPCVASSESGANELFRDGEGGFLFDPRDRQQVVEKISTLLDSPALRREMAKRGRAIILEKFSVEAMVDRFQTLYDSLLGESRPGWRRAA